MSALDRAVWQAATEFLPSNPRATLLAIADFPRSTLAEAFHSAVARIMAANR